MDQFIVCGYFFIHYFLPRYRRMLLEDSSGYNLLSGFSIKSNFFS